MNGIPVKLLVDGDAETVYFATRRAGENGEKMRAAKREYHDATTKAAAFMQRVALGHQKMLSLKRKQGDYIQKLEEIVDEQERRAQEANEARDNAIEAAMVVVQHSLKENYGDAASKFMAALNDSQIGHLVGVIETGDVDPDFFPCHAIQPSGSGSSPGTGSRSASSSKKGSRGGSTKKAK